MSGLFSRFSKLLATSTFTVSAIALAAPPAPPAPVPVPYPNNASQDSASGLATGKRMYKPVASSTSPTDSIAQRSVSCAAKSTEPVNQVASDPEEGGQIAKAGKTTGKTSIHSFNFTHKMDKSSPMLMDSSASGRDCH